MGQPFVGCGKAHCRSNRTKTAKVTESPYILRSCGQGGPCLDKGLVKRYLDHLKDEKLKSLDEAPQYLRDGVTFEQLDGVAHQVSDLEAAQALTHARNQLFGLIHKDPAAAV